MNLSRLRARLDRLAPAPSGNGGRDDRWRRYHLQLFESSRGLSRSEKRELARLNALFAEEDRIRERARPLFGKELAAKFLGGEPLSEAKMHELTELKARLPPPEEWLVAIARRYEVALEKFKQSSGTTGPQETRQGGPA
jgi:hypothetical protein